jgi:hypothetical protein
MHFVSFSQLGSAAASPPVSLVTPEKRIKTECFVDGKRSDSSLGDLRSQVLLLNADIGNLSRKIIRYAPMDPCRLRIPELSVTAYPATLTDEKFWCTPSNERDSIYEAIAVVFFDIVTMAELSGFNLRNCILKKMQLNRRKYKLELCKVSRYCFKLHKARIIPHGLIRRMNMVDYIGKEWKIH